MEKRTIVVNNQPIQFSPERFVRPIGWVIAALFGLFLWLRYEKRVANFALYFNQVLQLRQIRFSTSRSASTFSLCGYDLIAAGPRRSRWSFLARQSLICFSLSAERS